MVTVYHREEKVSSFAIKSTQEFRVGRYVWGDHGRGGGSMTPPDLVQFTHGSGEIVYKNHEGVGVAGLTSHTDRGATCGENSDKGWTRGYELCERVQRFGRRGG